MAAIRFRTVAFDLDGTLADTAPDLTAALNHALAYLGRPPVPDADVRHMVGHGARALLNKGLAATGKVSPELVEEGFPTFLDYYQAHIADRTRPFPGVEAALDALAAQGIGLAVCTNKLEGLARSLIDAFGWSARFASIVGGDTLAVRKPDPAPLLLAVEQAGGGPGVLIGDSITDVDTARAARMPCIAVGFGFSDRPPSELGADVLIDDFKSLLTALEQI